MTGFDLGGTARTHWWSRCLRGDLSLSPKGSMYDNMSDHHNCKYVSLWKARDLSRIPNLQAIWDQYFVEIVMEIQSHNISCNYITWHGKFVFPFFESFTDISCRPWAVYRPLSRSRKSLKASPYTSLKWLYISIPWPSVPIHSIESKRHIQTIITCKSQNFPLKEADLHSQEPWQPSEAGSHLSHLQAWLTHFRCCNIMLSRGIGHRWQHWTLSEMYRPCSSQAVNFTLMPWAMHYITFNNIKIL